VPFALQNGSHSAAIFRQAVSSVVPNTGGIVQAGDLAVTQTGTPSMGVVVGVGRAWVPGTNVANFSGTTYSSQAQYFALNDAPVTLTIASADPTNPRIDIVCLTVNDSNYSGSTNSAVLQVITGTPAASPAAPAAPANSMVLANVSVAANATSVVNANITQQQINGIGYANPTLTVSTGNFVNYAGYGALQLSFNSIARVATLTGNVGWVNGSNGNTVTTIPTGYRPPYQISFSSISQNNATGGEGTKYRGTVETSGIVTLNWMSNGLARDVNNVIPIQASWLVP
jgi:hypothetical protein